MVETHIEKRTQMADDTGDFDHDKVRNGTDRVFSGMACECGTH